MSTSKPVKILFLDCETTGLETDAAIIQIAAIAEIDGKVVDAFDAKIRPFPDDTISDEALAINGRTRKEIADYKPANEVFKAITARLGAWVDRYDRDDKFFLCAYNSQYDARMVEAWFKKNGDPYYGSWFHRPGICVYSLAGFMRYMGHLPTENLKQVTVAKHFGIEFSAHDAKEDVLVTREIFLKFMEILGRPSHMEKVAGS